MSRRFLASMGALAVVVTATSLPAVPVEGQTPKTTTAANTAAAKPYVVPHTPWGDPDLRGIWNNATSTPMQRPERFGDKAVLPEDEAEQVEEELARTQNRDNRDGGAEAQVIQGYNEV